MTLQEIPDYQRIPDEECGSTFGIDFDVYRALCRTALGIIRGHPDQVMGVYQLKESGLGLDIFIGELALAILVRDEEVGLFCCGLDETVYRTLVVSDSSDESFRMLGKLARKELRKYHA